MVKKNKAEVFHPSGDVRRVQSLGGGRFVRIGDHNGKWHHLSVERDADDIWHLLTIVNADNPELAVRIVAELTAMNPDFARFGDAIGADA
jgi:hypothetical protein